MDLTTIQSILEIGENIAVEFKRCGNGIESDTYETVCSFLNRFGGDIFLGVLNDGTVLGITKNAISDMVKNFIKELGKVPLDSDNYEESVKLLTNLYCLICKACDIYLFSTEDPFRSIGWEQPDFFALVVSKTFADGYSREKIAQLLSYAVSGGLSRESLHIQQETVFLNSLRTSDVKYMAMEEAKRQVEENESRLKAIKKYDDGQYALKDTINELCSMIFLITIELGEPEEGVEYFFNHFKELDKEITLYCALQLVDWMDKEELWMDVYKYGLGKKVTPRDSLQKEYAERQKRGCRY